MSPGRYRIYRVEAILSQLPYQTFWQTILPLSDPHYEWVGAVEGDAA